MRSVKPWLWVSPRIGHWLAPLGVKLLAFFQPRRPSRWRPLVWRGLEFPNRLGIAGGIDKDGKNIIDWHRLGVGFVEVGTVTPEPQGPNPGTIIDRDPSRQALWNKMGFPSQGLEAVSERLCALNAKTRPVIFLNAGKNRETPNIQAGQDYIRVMRKFENFVDAFVINISSPNTKGLRDLLGPSALRVFLQQIFKGAATKKPVLIKLSPDVNEAELQEIIRTAVEVGVSGFVITNSLANQPDQFPQHEGGGVSGLPLQERSREILRFARANLDYLGSDALLVSVGGVLNYDEIKKRFDMGADLVQVYSAIVFEGPFFFRKMAKEAKWH